LSITSIKVVAATTLTFAQWCASQSSFKTLAFSFASFDAAAVKHQ
jgi:hypothetical protein